MPPTDGSLPGPRGNLSKEVCVAYGRGREGMESKEIDSSSSSTRKSANDDGVAIIGSFTVMEYTDLIRKKRGLLDPAYCLINYSDCKRLSLFTGKEIWISSVNGVTTSQDKSGGKTQESEFPIFAPEARFLTVLSVIPDTAVPSGVEEKKLRMMKLRSKDVVLAACYGEEPEVSTAKRISLILQDGGGMGAEGSFNLSGLRLYAAGELVLGQVVRLRYLGREYSLRVEGIDTLNGTPGSTFSPSKVCSFTEVNMLAEDLYGNNKKTKDLFLIDKPYGLDYQVDTLIEVARMALGDQKEFEDIGIKMPRGILVIGPRGTGKALASDFAARTLNIRTILLSPDDFYLRYLSRITVFESAVEALGQTGPSILILKNIELISGKEFKCDPDIVEKIIKFFNSNRESKTLIIATASRIELLDSRLRCPGRLEYEIEVGMPNSNTKSNILSSLLKDRRHSLSEKEIEDISSSTHGYTGSDIISLYMKALSIADQGSKLGFQHFRSAMKKMKPMAISDITLEIPEVEWDHIGGQESIKERLKEAVEFPLKHRHLFEKYKITQVKGLLLYGPPGCSKTLMAKALATESNLNFLAVKGPELFSKWVGESEKAVREVFRRARSVAPSIIFFDEIDSIASKRSTQSNEISVKDRLLSQLLTEMDGIEEIADVVIVAATNRPDLIDPALLRPGRIDRMLYVGPPDREARAKIFKLRLDKCICKSKMSPEQLADKTSGYSGAECIHLVHEACMAALEEARDVEVVRTLQAIAFANWRKISLQHFKVAFDRVKPQITPDLIKFYENFKNGTRIKQI